MRLNHLTTTNPKEPTMTTTNTAHKATTNEIRRALAAIFAERARRAMKTQTRIGTRNHEYFAGQTLEFLTVKIRDRIAKAAGIKFTWCVEGVTDGRIKSAADYWLKAGRMVTCREKGVRGRIRYRWVLRAEATRARKAEEDRAELDARIERDRAQRDEALAHAVRAGAKLVDAVGFGTVLTSSAGVTLSVAQVTVLLNVLADRKGS